MYRIRSAGCATCDRGDPHQERRKAPYGNTKQINEEIIADTIKSGSPIKAILLRYFNPIGAHPTAFIGEMPNGVPQNLIPYLTQTAMGIRKELSVFGDDYDTPDGSCIRDYIYVVDLAKAHVMRHDAHHGRPDIPNRWRFTTSVRVRGTFRA